MPSGERNSDSNLRSSEDSACAAESVIADELSSVHDSAVEVGEGLVHAQGAGKAVGEVAATGAEGVGQVDAKAGPTPVRKNAEDAPLGSLPEAAGKAALAAVLAGSVTAGAAALTPDKVVLPEPTPITYVLEQPPVLPDSVVDDKQPSKAFLLERLLKFGKFILLALALVAAIVVGITQGCASCAGPLAAPIGSGDSSQSQNQSSSVQAA